MTLFQHGNSGVDVMFLFNIVHILQLLVFENILAYKNVTSYIYFSIAYGFERNLRAEKHPTNWKMVYIWTTNNLLRYINMNTIRININKFSLNLKLTLSTSKYIT
jgi:hypothetical protein